MALLMWLVTIVPGETPMEFVRELVRTGPSMLASWTLGQQILLSAQNDYGGAKAQVSEATYLFRSYRALRAAMVQAGEANLSSSISQFNATNAKTDFSYLESEIV